MDKKVDFVSSDQGDWIGMYVDGKLVDEGHSLSEYAVLRALGIEYTSRELDFDSVGISHCPSNLSDLPEE